MGYCVSQGETEFFIAADVAKEAWDKALAYPEEEARRWELEHDEAGNIVDLYFDGDKMGVPDEIFSLIAPYVKAGSFITMTGEDGSCWRYCFDGKVMIEKTATFV